MEAVILAAGRGTRLGDAHPGSPKPLLTIGDTTIIDRMLTVLGEAGVDGIVVGGYMAEELESATSRHQGVRFVRNERFADSGTMVSLAAGLRARSDPTQRSLVLNGDIVFERRAIPTLIDTPHDQSFTIVTNLAGRGDEAYAGVDNGQITGISKNRSEVGASIAELVGISIFTPRTLGAMSRAQTGPKANYESAMGKISPNSPINATVLDDLVWGEVDDAAQLTALRTRIYPEILRREHHTSTAETARQ